ncbi:MAG: segregation/condensation protein A [Gammaproteobacteria bacterium]|nr:segregation/condensation protein A [Gammaproteobacteria bacterium]NNC97641.1 segregation/condensation protein A [Gammaproteobacteria bacterium]NNM13194.1 segregation/condensation protein A [Gammaproteobacteria bacterium]
MHFTQPQQGEMPFAFVAGEPLSEMPKDLYIPPDALEIFLEAFEGPLDLLLYLIKRQNLDILNIPIAEITRQYMSYIDLMETLQLELAAEYLVMAAMLAEIKSRMLLPRPVEDDADENDPRAELIRRLQEYERFKTAAEDLGQLPRMERDTFQVKAEVVERHIVKQEPTVELKELLMAFAAVIKRSEMFEHHHINFEKLSVRQRMGELLMRLDDIDFVEFTDLFDAKEGRMGAVVTLLAILELTKEALLDIVQAEPYAKIHVKRAPMQSDQNAELPETSYADETDNESL